MDYRILGPFEVAADGVALDLGGLKPRAVLAVLLLDRNRVISVDRLADEVWGERPPPSVRAAILNCVSRLRRVLGARQSKHGPLVIACVSRLTAWTRFDSSVRSLRLPGSGRGSVPQRSPRR